MGRKKKSVPINCMELGFEEDIEECGFSDGVPVGTVMNSFSFGNEAVDKSKDISMIFAQEKGSEKNTNIVDNNRGGKTISNGITPPIDGEYFKLKRSYSMRKSTVKMLNELKGLHPNVNTYMNTIVDAAIRHYYDYVTKEGGEQI